MNIFLYTVIVFVALYFFVVFFLARFSIPFMGFKKYPLPRDIPDEIKQTVTALEQKYPDADSFLRAAYEFVLQKWEHHHLGVIPNLPRLFRTDITQVWRDKGFVHCNHINLIAMLILAHSRFFTIDDIELRYVFLNFVPHQYLRVRLNKNWIDFDPAGAGIRGKPLGTHQKFFG